jgi:tetratricopeptide (TPR) repeat protein
MAKRHGQARNQGKSPATLDLQGVALAEAGRHAEAAGYFERALTAQPAAAEAAFHLGNSLLALDRLDDARRAFERALTLRPAYAGPRNGLGAVCARLGDENAAIAAFREALAIDPAFADAACNLGTVLLETGDVPEAVRWFERAIELEPDSSHFFLQLVRSRSKPLEPARIAAMSALTAPAKRLARPALIELHFALAKAYEDAERYDDAFRHLSAGNALKRTELAYDPELELGFFINLGRVVDAPLVDSLRGYGNPSEQPVFVFGMARSGSTLVEQILAAHPAVAAAGEIAAFGRLMTELHPPIGTGAPAAAAGASLREVGDRYLEATARIAGPATRITDKTLANFALAPLIHAALPNARLIHVRRDWLDTCCSCFATLFLGSYVPFSYDLGELARYYHAYEQLVTRWRAILPPDRFLEVSYETVVADIETETRRIVAFCGLPWDDACLAFQGARRAVHTASAFQVRQPLYNTAIGRAQRFGAHLEPLITAMAACTHP